MCLIKNSYQNCINGHEFTKENTYVTPNGYRQCVICKRENKRRWYRNSKLKKLAA